jgi:hypothetical protein
LIAPACQPRDRPEISKEKKKKKEKQTKDEDAEERHGTTAAAPEQLVRRIAGIWCPLAHHHHDHHQVRGPLLFLLRAAAADGPAAAISRRLLYRRGPHSFPFRCGARAPPYIPICVVGLACMHYIIVIVGIVVVVA